MKIRFFVPITLIVIAVLSLVNCSKNKETQFVIQVDSISVADTVDLGQDIEIEFFGTIGPDGCHSYSHLDVSYESSTLICQVWGKNSGAKECTNVIVLLDGLKLTVDSSTLNDGDNTIEIQQPDNSKLTQPIYIRP